MSSGGSWELLLRQASAAAEDTGAALLAADGPLHQADALSLVLCRSLEDENWQPGRSIDSTADDGSPSTSEGVSGLAALQRKLERLARAKGPPTDVEALVQDGKLNAALGARLRRQPAYLRSCSPAAGAPSTPITPLRLVRPNSTDVKEELLPPAFADLPNAITSPKRANQRLFVSAHNDGEDSALQGWIIQTLRASASSSTVANEQHELTASRCLLGALWHLCPNGEAAWDAVLAAAAASQASAGAGDTSLLGTAPSTWEPLGGGELAGKEGSSSPAAGLRWYKRPSRVIPVLAGGEAEPPPYHHDPGTEQLLMETVCKGEKYARDWGRMLLGLPETASPAGLEATLLAPGLAMLRVGLRLAFARLPEHLEAHNLRQLLDAIPLRLERALCSWHGVPRADTAVAPPARRLLLAYRSPCVWAAVKNQAACAWPELEAALAQHLGRCMDGALARCAPGSGLCSVPLGLWPQDEDGHHGGRPRQVMAPMAEALQAISRAAAWAEASLPVIVLEPACTVLLGFGRAAACRVEQLCMCRPAAGDRNYRLSVLSAAECCLHVLRSSVARLLQQAASSTWDALGTSQWRLRAEASAAEARMLQARVAALDMVAGAEAELLCGVIAASVDACPWTSFRPPLALKDCAGPATRLWAAQLWWLLDEAAVVLSPSSLKQLLSRVLTESLETLQRRYMGLSPSKVAWLARFAGDTSLLCSTAFCLCHHLPGEVSASGQGSSHRAGLQRHRNPLVSDSACAVASSLCRSLATRSGLLSCSAARLVSQLNAVQADAESPRAPWEWVPPDVREQLLIAARRQRRGAAALSGILTGKGAGSSHAEDDALWRAIASHLAASCSRAEAESALLLRGELHPEVPGLPYSEEHLEARRVLQNAAGGVAARA